ncbi:MAG: ABC transporter ATP-binding protein [Oligoflexia bacterium]|nr:ABC transporter ATP-binding protein [Oligoflexia bacterium]
MDITINNLCKSYGSIAALKNCSIVVPSGSVFALIGPNGAGKTTLVKALLSLVKIDSGTIALSGSVMSECESLLREQISYLPEKYAFYPYYTVENILKLVGRVYVSSLRKRGGSELDTMVTKALERAQIVELRARKVKTLSKGQLQRVGVAQLLMCDVSSPRLFILDEPFSGLDPIGIRDLKVLISELHQQGHTIFINSHILSEIEQIADEVAVLHHGEILALGKIKELVGNKNLEEFFYNKIKGA